VRVRSRRRHGGLLGRRPPPCGRSADRQLTGHAPHPRRRAELRRIDPPPHGFRHWHIAPAGLQPGLARRPTPYRGSLVPVKPPVPAMRCRSDVADPVFTCGCGHSADQDCNAAVTLARWGQTQHNASPHPRTPKQPGRATNARRRDGAGQHPPCAVKPARLNGTRRAHRTSGLNQRRPRSAVPNTQRSCSTRFKLSSPQTPG
jgi:hypothetical protein